MRWLGGRESSNIEDRRGVSMGRGLVGGGIGTVGLIIVALLFGVDPSELLNAIDTGQQQSASFDRGAPVRESADEAQLHKFVSVVLAQTEDSWAPVFRKMGRTYVPPKLVLFTGGVQSACGSASTASGPFYCPADSRVYLDLDFLRELSTRFGAPGDFARAYVIAHEVGHHVQNQLGIMDRTRQARDRGGSEGISVRTELQADCLAGVWAHDIEQTQHILEAGDIESGLRAAASVGDDRLQKASTGRVVPDSFTHGTSAQRARWFRHGFDQGDIQSCDTFGAPEL
jgi:predicted metalloprotease